MTRLAFTNIQAISTLVCLQLDDNGFLMCNYSMFNLSITCLTLISQHLCFHTFKWIYLVNYSSYTDDTKWFKKWTLSPMPWCWDIVEFISIYIYFYKKLIWKTCINWKKIETSIKHFGAQCEKSTTLGPNRLYKE